MWEINDQLDGQIVSDKDYSNTKSKFKNFFRPAGSIGQRNSPKFTENAI